MNKSLLEKELDLILKPNGFKKKGATWYRRREEILHGVDLQKSNFGEQFFLNIFIVPGGMDIEGLPTPKEHRCPVRVRLTALFAKEKNKIEEAFDLERSLSDDERKKFLAKIVGEDLIRCLNTIATNQELAEFIHAGNLDGGLVTVAAKDWLGLLKE